RGSTEGWSPHHQIRDARAPPGLAGPRHVAAVVATFVHALPRSLDAVPVPAGTTVDLEVSGEGGGTWHAVAVGPGWDLRAGASPTPACRLTAPAGDAWRLYAGYPGVTFTATGDPALAAAASGGRAIIT